MKNNKTEIVIVLDSSGSMTSIKLDMEGGIKTFLEEQEKQPGECRITYYRFNDTVTRVFENVDIENVREIKFKPLGSTALFDAIGQAINEVGSRLSSLQEKDRPGKLIFIIVSDGAENASKEFDLKQIKDMIKHQEDKYSWEFIYLGANQDAFAVGQSFGVTGGNSMTYSTDSVGVGNTYKALSTKVRMARADMNYSFTDEDRAASINQ